jgi:hypothetical protein
VFDVDVERIARRTVNLDIKPASRVVAPDMHGWGDFAVEQIMEVLTVSSSGQISYAIRATGPMLDMLPTTERYIGWIVLTQYGKNIPAGFEAVPAAITRHLIGPSQLWSWGPIKPDWIKGWNRITRINERKP